MFGEAVALITLVTHLGPAATTVHYVHLPCSKLKEARVLARLEWNQLLVQ